MEDFDIRAGGTNIKVTGLTELGRRLRAAGADVTDLNDVMAEIGQIVINNTHPPVRTGRLANTIRASKTRYKSVIRAGNATTVPYAGPIHWSWPARHIRANKFLTRAVDQSYNQVIATLDKGITEIIAKNHL
jgi:hypothetical protein